MPLSEASHWVLLTWNWNPILISCCTLGNSVVATTGNIQKLIAQNVRPKKPINLFFNLGIEIQTLSTTQVSLFEGRYFFLFHGDQYHHPALVQIDNLVFWSPRSSSWQQEELLSNFKKPFFFFFYADKALAVELFNIPEINMLW